MNDLKENYMKKEFDEIVRLCEEAKEDYGEESSYFMEPATDEEIVEWENQTNISIPESYKLWLRLTKCCQIRTTVASLYFPKITQAKLIPKDYIVIGDIVGDGELVCFSKTTGKFITYFEGEIEEEYEEFSEIIEEIKKLLSDELPELNLTEEKIKEMLALSEALRKESRQ